MRSLYYIHPKIQFPFSGLMTALVAIELLIFGLVFIVTDRMALALGKDLATYLQYGSLLVVILVFSAFNLLLGARLSHRIAGPLVQVQRVLQKARQGNYAVRANIRGNDYLQEIVEDLNLLLQSLENKQNAKPNPKNDKEHKIESNNWENIS